MACRDTCRVEYAVVYAEIGGHGNGRAYGDAEVSDVECAWNGGCGGLFFAACGRTAQPAVEIADGTVASDEYHSL